MLRKSSHLWGTYSCSLPPADNAQAKQPTQTRIIRGVTLPPFNKLILSFDQRANFLIKKKNNNNHKNHRMMLVFSKHTVYHVTSAAGGVLSHTSAVQQEKNCNLQLVSFSGFLKALTERDLPGSH